MARNVMRRAAILLARVAAFAAAAFLAVGSWTPADQIVRSGLDGAIEHVIAYTVTGTLFILAYGSWPFWQIALALALYAGVLEFGQWFVPGRDPSLHGFAASATGIIIASAAGVALRRVGSL